MAYKPSIVPAAEELPGFLQDELSAVGDEFDFGLCRNLEFLTVAPLKPREGNVCGADGTIWNPGAGKGVYVYFAGAWHALVIVRENVVTLVAVNTTLTLLHRTVVSTVSGLTHTLPAAATALIGQDWTVALGVAGTCTIVCAGANTFASIVSETDTSLVLGQRGDSVTFRCLTATTWGLI